MDRCHASLSAVVVERDIVEVGPPFGCEVDSIRCYRGTEIERVLIQYEHCRTRHRYDPVPSHEGQSFGIGSGILQGKMSSVIDIDVVDEVQCSVDVTVDTDRVGGGSLPYR